VHYRFGEYLLDTQRYALWDQNAWTPLRPKIFAVLLYLLQHRDRVVSKTELLEHIWPAQCIGDGSLNACLMAVRKVLGDTGQTQRYIQTLRGHGYRFVALVHEEAEETLAPPPALQHDAPLVAPPAPLDPPASVRLPVGFPDAARRHLTVLHGALADASRLAEQLDPETFREVVQAYHQTCQAVMPRFGGYVAQYHEASILTYFGYPQARDGAAHHAVRAGLALLAAWEAVQARLAQQIGCHIAICVGIDTGLVVVGEAHDEALRPPLALGRTPRRAALIQAWASPGTVVISAATHRLVEDACVPLGQHTLHSMVQPLALYRALPAPDLERGLAVPISRSLTPLVGREAEMVLLVERWTQVKAAFGHVVVLSGEAGIGKSRLVAAVQAQLAQEPHACLEGRCTPYDQHVAWSPLKTALQRFLHWHPHESAAAQLAALEQAVQQYGLTLDTTVPGLARLLGSNLPEAPYDLPPLDPPHQRQQILTALLALLTAVARRQPLVFILEDLHWSDPSTLELLERLVDSGPTAAIYTIVTCRPPFQPAWVGRAHVTPLVVPRLSPGQAATLIRRVAGSTALPSEVLHHLVQQTDGVPLFLEELTKTVLESDALHQPAGQPLAPFAQYQPRLTAYRTRSGPLGLAQHLVWLAEAYGQRGQSTEGLQALTEAHNLVAYTGEQLVRADMLRVHGELLSSGAVHSQAGALAPPGTTAEGLLQQALLLAQQQQAKILELRAAVRLSRLWQQQGQGAQAREVLGAVYSWFTEGFETVDLQEARVLLADLSGPLG